MTLQNYVTRDEYIDALELIALLAKRVTELERKNRPKKRGSAPMSYVNTPGQDDQELATEHALVNCILAVPTSVDPLTTRAKTTFSRNELEIRLSLGG